MLGRRMVRKDQQRGVMGSVSADGTSEQHNAPLGRKLRSEVVSSGVFALLKSPLLGFLVVMILSVVVAIFSEFYAVLIIPVLWAAFRYKILLYEFFLALHVIENTMGIWPWYTLVDTDLYLGALPLESHIDNMTKKLRINAVLSINEDFELHATSMVGRPVSPSQWKRLDINHLQISAPDYFPPSVELLDKGADFINAELSEGKKVYCHCKSGVGRSACTVAAYFIKYRKMDAETTHTELIARRPFIFKKNSRQMRMIKQYENWLRSKSMM